MGLRLDSTFERTREAADIQRNKEEDAANGEAVEVWARCIFQDAGYLGWLLTCWRLAALLPASGWFGDL